MGGMVCGRWSLTGLWEMITDWPVGGMVCERWSVGGMGCERWSVGGMVCERWSVGDGH